MKRLEYGLSLLLVGGLILVLILLWLLPSGTPKRAESVFSAEDDGRRAAFLLLDGLGFEARSWTRSPGHLPRGKILLVVSEIPETPPAYDTMGRAVAARAPDRVTVQRTARRLRDPLHYLRFVEEGGTLVVPASQAHLDFLTEVLGLEEVRQVGLVWEERDEEDVPAVREVLLRSGEPLALSWRPQAHFRTMPVSAPFEVLAADADRASLCLRLRVGRGAVVLLAPEDDLFANQAIGELDNALFLVRLVEQLAPSQVLFDEYALGGWVPDSPIELAFAPQSFGFSLHLILWASLGLWVLAWAREFPRDPEPLAQVSAVVRARGFAAMLVGAGRWDILGRMLRAGVLRRLGARVGVTVSTSSTAPRTLGEELSAKRVRAVVARLLPGGDPARREAATVLIASQEVGDAAALERLGRRLAQLEAVLLAPAPGAGRTSGRGKEAHGRT